MQASALYKPTFDEVVEYGRPEIPLPRRKRHLSLVPNPRDNPSFEIQNTITRDQPLGSKTGSMVNGAAGSMAITTGQIAAAGSRIVICVSWFDSNNSAVTVADTVGSYTLDRRFDNGGDHYAVFSRVLVGSYASGSSITASWTTGVGGGGALCAACSYLGTTGVDTGATNSTSGTGFSSGAASNAIADSLFVGGAGNEGVSNTVGGTNTNGTMRFDIWNTPDGQGMRMLDLIATTIGSQALTGTWPVSSTATTGALVIYSGIGPQPITHVAAMDMMRARTL